MHIGARRDGDILGGSNQEKMYETERVRERKLAAGQTERGSVGKHSR